VTFYLPTLLLALVFGEALDSPFVIESFLHEAGKEFPGQGALPLRLY
jgi:hypothetical protein